MKFVLGVLTLFWGMVLPAHAQSNTPSPAPTFPPSTQIEIGGSAEHLGNGYSDWYSTYLFLLQKVSQRQSFYGWISSQARYGLTDPQYIFGFYTPLSSETILNVEASYSPTHRTLAQNEIAASLDHRLARGYGYQLGARRRTYQDLSADIAQLGVDHYYGNQRLAYTLSLSQLSNVPGLAATHSATFTHYYGGNADSSVSFNAAAGRDVENVGTRVAIYPTFQAGASGLHWYAQHAGFTWSAYLIRQGDLYTRRGIQIGLRYRT